MLKIWGRKNSSNVRKALWCAEEIGLPYQRIDAGGNFGVVNDAEYRAKNPNGLVPMIEDGDFVLWESNVIVRYLALRYAPDSLCPASPAERALAECWMDWTSTTFATPFRTVFWGLLRIPEDQRDMPAIEAAIRTCAEALEVPERTLAAQSYLSGARFGMGDIPLGSFIYAWFELPIVRPSMPALEAWYARLRERPAYRRAVMTELT